MGNQYATKGRFKPKHTSVSGAIFDSAFEAAVWKELEKIRQVIVVRQHPLLLKPKTPKFAEISWAVDFSVEERFHNIGSKIYVEAKGALESEFLRNIRLLEYRAPGEFESLLIVFPDNFPNHEKGLKIIRKAENSHLKWCTKSDLIDTVKTRLLLPHA